MRLLRRIALALFGSAPAAPKPAPRVPVLPRLIHMLWVVVFNIAAVLAILSLLELAILGTLRFPFITARLPHAMKFYPIWVYTYLDRTKAGDFYRFDEDLGYTLQQDIDVQWSNREFSVRLTTNSLGFRDDEQSTVAPKVVVLGDSFAMGWGVEAKESFAEVVEKELALKTLNTGLPSYGTPRQVRLLDTVVDTSALECLAVQYCENDLLENTPYIQRRGARSKGNIEHYYAARDADRKLRQYYFGKYLREEVTTFARRFGAEGHGVRLATPLENEFYHLKHAKQFLHVLSELKALPPNVRLVLFDLWDRSDLGYLRPERRFDSHLFMQLLAKLIEEEDYPGFIENALLIDTSTFLIEDDYFVLDGHITRQGHEKVAQSIIHAIQSEEGALGDEVTLLTTREGRAAYSLRETVDPLPDTAYRSEITCDPGEYVITPSQEELEIELTIANHSPDWWYVQENQAPYYIRVRASLLDETKAEIARNYMNGAVVLPYPVGPGSVARLPIQLSAAKFPQGVSYLRYDLVLENHAWFSGKGGTPCLIRFTKE